MELRSISPQGGEAAALPFGRTRGFKPRVRYNLIGLELADLEKCSNCHPLQKARRGQIKIFLERQRTERLDHTQHELSGESVYRLEAPDRLNLSTSGGRAVNPKQAPLQEQLHHFT